MGGWIREDVLMIVHAGAWARKLDDTPCDAEL